MDAAAGRMLARRDVLLLALAAACWGVGTVVSKRAIEEMPPLVLFPVQLAGSLLVLALLMRRAGLPLAGGSPLLGRLGMLNPGLAYALGLIGLTYISASLYVLLWALEPLLILVLAGVFLGERISARFLLLSVVAATGMGLVVYQPASAGQWPGVVLTLAGVGCCAAYTVIARRWVGTADSTAQVVLAQQAWALGFAVVVAVGAAVLGGTPGWSGVSPAGLLAALASGLLYYAAAYWFYLSALRTVPASLAATAFYLIPVFGLVASFLLLGDRLEPTEWVGVAIVVAAILSIIRLSTREPAAPTTAARPAEAAR
jgi:drug/metabolite transporter (DMT)-like permease